MMVLVRTAEGTLQPYVILIGCLLPMNIKALVCSITTSVICPCAVAPEIGDILRFFSWHLLFVMLIACIFSR